MVRTYALKPVGSSRYISALDRLSLEAGISKFHFVRLFRTSTGLTPHAFLVGLRMGAARTMLSRTDLSVAAIATRCGYAHAEHFGTAFAKRFGVSPRAFRAHARGGSNFSGMTLR